MMCEKIISMAVDTTHTCESTTHHSKLILHISSHLLLYIQIIKSGKVPKSISFPFPILHCAFLAHNPL